MSDAFTHQVFRTAIARSLKMFRYQTASESSLDILVDATINRISEIASEAARRAACCGRTEANAYDLITALSEYDISLQALFSLLMNLHKYPSPTYEYLISPYPIAKNSDFYKHQINTINQLISAKNKNYQAPSQMTYQAQAQLTADSIVNDIFVPFRSNTTINYFAADNILNTSLNNPNSQNNHPINQINPNSFGNMSNMIGTNPILSNSNTISNPQSISVDDNAPKNNDYIPYFYSNLPPEYTYDETPMSDSLSEGEALILAKSREDDQRESKESLAQLNKSSVNDKLYDSSEFELNLLKPPEIDKPIGKFAEKSGAYQMDGENPGIDPEFMPKLDSKDVNNSLQTNTKEIKSMVNILTNSHEKHGKNEGDAKNDD